MTVDMRTTSDSQTAADLLAFSHHNHLQGLWRIGPRKRKYPESGSGALKKCLANVRGQRSEKADCLETTESVSQRPSSQVDQSVGTSHEDNFFF